MVITPAVLTVTVLTALPLIEAADGNPAEALLVGHAALDAKYSPTPAFAAEAKPKPSETRARFV